MEIANWITVSATVVLALTAIGVFIFNGINIRRMRISIEITKDKERIDRALDYADKFDYKKLMDLSRLKTKEKNKDIRSSPKGLSNLYYLIRYFDKLAILYFNGKINEEIFEGHIEPMLVNFAYWFKNEIYNELKELKAGKGYYWFINFAKLADKVLMKSKYQDGRYFTALYLLTAEYKKIISEDK